MKLSTRARYGVRAMLELGLRETQSPVSTKEIADDQQVSAKYLEAVLANLRKAGLIRSVRGAGGGHVLAKAPSEINLRDIYEALEGTESFVSCTVAPGNCRQALTCVPREIWAAMYAAAMGVLEAITLEELVRRTREKQETLSSMYYI